MKAVGFQKSLPITDQDALQDIDLPRPRAVGRDLLVRVEAVSVNPVDYKVRQGRPPESGWKVLGYDAAGVVEEIGDQASLFQVGDRVWYAGDLTRSGSNAEFQLVDERIVGRMPTSLGFAQAAALPLTTITAWEMLFDRLQVSREKSESILLVGAAGGVGSIMVQLLKRLTNLTVVGTASRPDSVDWLRRLGTDHVIDHRQPLSQGLAAVGIAPVEYLVSLNQTEGHYDEIVASLKPQGRFGLIDDPAQLDPMKLKSKSISLHWEFMFTRSMYQTDDVEQQHYLLGKVAELVDQSLLESTVAHHLGPINAANLRQAHSMLESQQAHGKIVLEGF